MNNETIQSPDVKLTKNDLRKMWVRWQFGTFSSFSYEKLQGNGYVYSMIPFANKFYRDDSEGKNRLLTRHAMFYNTESQAGTVVNGIVASLEEQIALGNTNINEEAPVSIKTTLMGPLAGIGDSIIQGIIIPTLLSIGIGLSTGGSILGPLFYIISYLAIALGISYFGFMSGYDLGVNAIEAMVGENASRITNAFNTIGVMVVGGLAASQVTLATTLQIPMGEEMGSLQEILDGIFPQLLPLIMVLFAWYLLSKKKLGATKVIVILTVVSILGVVIGVF